MSCGRGPDPCCGGELSASCFHAGTPPLGPRRQGGDETRRSHRICDRPRHRVHRQCTSAIGCRRIRNQKCVPSGLFHELPKGLPAPTQALRSATPRTDSADTTNLGASLPRLLREPRLVRLPPALPTTPTYPKLEPNTRPRSHTQTVLWGLRTQTGPQPPPDPAPPRAERSLPVASHRRSCKHLFRRIPRPPSPMLRQPNSLSTLLNRRRPIPATRSPPDVSSQTHACVPSLTSRQPPTCRTSFSLQLNRSRRSRHAVCVCMYVGRSLKRATFSGSP